MIQGLFSLRKRNTFTREKSKDLYIEKNSPMYTFVYTGGVSATIDSTKTRTVFSERQQ